MKKFFLMMALPAFLFVACKNEKTTDEGMKEEKVTDNAESKEEKNKQTALASVNAFIAGDVDAVVKDVTTDAIDYNDGSMPPTKGLDSIKAGIKQWRENFSDYKGENLMAVADGDYVAIFGDWSATFKKDFMGMKAAGKSFKIKDADIFRFNADGKMTEHRSIQSSAEMMKQLGAAAPK